MCVENFLFLDYCVKFSLICIFMCFLPSLLSQGAREDRALREIIYKIMLIWRHSDLGLAN